MGFHGPDFPDPIKLVVGGIIAGAVLGAVLLVAVVAAWPHVKAWLHAVTG